MAMFVGWVRMSPLEFCIKSKELSVLRWNIILCMTLGFIFGRALYLIMAVLQLIVVCLTMIL